MRATRTAAREFAFRLRVIVAIGVVFGAAVGAIGMTPQWLGAGLGAVSGAVDFAIMATLIGGANTFLPATRLGRALDRAPFLAGFAAKSLAYAGVIVGVVLIRPGLLVAGLLIDGDLAAHMWREADAKIQPALLIPMVFLVMPMFILIGQLRRLIGERTLRNIVSGRYHRPRIEERFFLFVDIVGSTPLAERLGPEAIHRFLNRVFGIMSGPIDDHGGEVYQYVGDEAVITWTVPEGRAAARPLACCFAIERALADEAACFTRDFGIVPRLRAALHAGEVITGEFGGTRRAIVFHGDVMNTTSRIENATRDLGRSFLVSEDAVLRLDGADAYDLVDLGPQWLRGRQAALRLYAASPASQAGQTA